MLRNGFFGQYASGISHEVEQQIEFLFGDCKDFILNEYLTVLRQNTHFSDFIGQLTIEFSASQQRFDARVELRQVEGFGQVIVGSQIQTTNLVVQRVPCREDNYSCFRMTFFYFANQAKSATIRQTDINKHTIIFIEVHLLPALIQCTGLFGAVAFLLQVSYNGFGEQGLIFYDQNLHTSNFTQK